MMKAMAIKTAVLPLQDVLTLKKEKFLYVDCSAELNVGDTVEACSSGLSCITTVTEKQGSTYLLERW